MGGKYDRVNPRYAADPLPRMRIYGRDPSGRLCTIVVHDVCRGNVYGALRRRHQGGFSLARWSLDDWTAWFREACDEGRIVGVQLPRILLAETEPARA